MSKIPVIIDCDPGIDDSIAIFLAHANPDMELIGLTPVAGNVPYVHTSNNAKNLAGLVGSDCVVTQGAQKPLMYTPSGDAASVHGANGVRGAVIENVHGKEITDVMAWDFIYEQAVKHSGELIVCPVGPLTNIATAIQKYPDLKDHVKRLVIMGGAYGPGNVTPYAEFNIWFDPDACQVVFESGIPITLCGLDCTMAAAITAEEIKECFGDDLPFSNLTNAIYDWVCEAPDVLADEGGWTIHDAITVAGVAYPDLYKTRPAFAYCVCDKDDKHLGQTVCDFGSETPNCDVAGPASKEKFVAILKEMAAFYRQ